MIIFLDIDGVLHPLFPRSDRPANDSAQFSYLPRLSAVLRDFPEAFVVISSTWRASKSLRQLKAIFPSDLQHRIIDTTPLTEDASEPGGREAEAISWLDAHPEHSSWIAIDDCASCWSTLGKLILCDDGFRGEEEDLLRDALKRFDL